MISAVPSVESMWKSPSNVQLTGFEGKDRGKGRKWKGLAQSKGSIELWLLNRGVRRRYRAILRRVGIKRTWVRHNDIDQSFVGTAMKNLAK